MTTSRVVNLYMFLSVLRECNVALSNLRVKGPILLPVCRSLEVRRIYMDQKNEEAFYTSWTFVWCILYSGRFRGGAQVRVQSIFGSNLTIFYVTHAKICHLKMSCRCAPSFLKTCICHYHTIQYISYHSVFTAPTQDLVIQTDGP